MQDAPETSGHYRLGLAQSRQSNQLPDRTCTTVWSGGWGGCEWAVLLIRQSPGWYWVERPSSLMAMERSGIAIQCSALLCVFILTPVIRDNVHHRSVASSRIAMQASLNICTSRSLGSSVIYGGPVSLSRKLATKFLIGGPIPFTRL